MKIFLNQQCKYFTMFQLYREKNRSHNLLSLIGGLGGGGGMCVWGGGGEEEGGVLSTSHRILIDS